MNNRNIYFILVISLLLFSTQSVIAQEDEESVVVYALPYDFNEYSQFAADSYATNQWLSAVRAGLFSRSSQYGNRLVPNLASEYPIISDDALTYTITLKNDLKFSDGTDLTAEDVVFTYQSLINPEINLDDYDYYTTFFDSILLSEWFN